MKLASDVGTAASLTTDSRHDSQTGHDEHIAAAAAAAAAANDDDDDDTGQTQVHAPAVSQC